MPAFFRSLLGFAGVLALPHISGLQAETLFVDRRGGAPYASLASAAARLAPGDTLVIAKGSGPYRETLR